jgi:hypothetical protein
MKHLAALLVAAILSGCAAIPGLQITDEDRARCEMHGCTVWTRAELEMLVREAMRRGIEAARKERNSI